MPSRQRILSTLVLALLAAGTWYLAEILYYQEPAPLRPSPGTVDYFSKNLRRTVLDEAGEPAEMLIAETMTHYENDDHTELDHAELTLYQKDGPPWVIRAERAELPGDSDDAFLYGAVLITREPDANGRSVRIETSNVRVQPKRKYAETDDDITVLSPPDSMTGTGAQINFAEELSFMVLANVKRKHDVQSR